MREVAAGGGSATRTELGYRPALDGLRAVAILFVMTYHSTAQVLPGGFIGVDIFFVLSGFLITTLLLEERQASGRIRVGLFYARRALRLLPALVLLVGACAVAALLLPHSAAASGTTTGVPASLFYVSNWVAAFGGKLGLLEHTWSLSVEEQFYLVWPVVLIVALAFGSRRTVLILCVATALAICVLRLAAWESSVTLVRTSKLYYLSRADSLLIGCSVALAASLGYVDRVPDRVVRVATWTGALVIAGFALLVHHWYNPLLYRGGLTLVAVAVGIVIVGLVYRPTAPLVAWLSLPAMVAIGKISYGLYLWHSPIGVLVRERWPSFPPLARPLVIWPLTFAAAFVSYKLVEQPALRLKARLTSTETARRRDMAVAAAGDVEDHAPAPGEPLRPSPAPRERSSEA